MIFLYVPCKDENEAKTISKALITKKLIACTNLIPISSLYFWQGNLQDDSEVVMLAKTDETKEQDARDEIESLHSYDTPAILSFPVTANPKYEEWLKGQLQ